LDVAQLPGRFARVPGKYLPRDDIEASASEASAAFPKPRVGAAYQSPPFPGVDGEFRRAEAMAAAGLDLDKDDGSSSPNDEIEFDAGGSDVAGNDAVPLGLQIVGCPGFAFVT
jgi:hypothetical protein